MRSGFLLVLAALIVSATSATAAPPAVSFGVELGVVSRDIEEEGALVDSTTPAVADSTRLIGRLGLQVAPALLLFGEVGVADLSIDEFDAYRSDRHLLYGGGARIHLYEGTYPGQMTVYSDLKVTRLQTDDQVTVCTANCNDPLVLPTETVVDEEIGWTEYGISLGIRGGYDAFRPFGGVRFSQLDGKDRIGSQTADIRERSSVGFFIGADLFLDRDERTALMIQLSGGDENAFRVGYKASF